MEHQGVSLEVSGRIDGIITAAYPIIIEEIKTSGKELETLRLEPDPMHPAQLKCYSYLHALQHELSTIGTRLSYIHIHSGEVLEIDGQYSIEALESFFYSLLIPYLDHERNRLLLIEQLIRSIERTIRN